ncbi:MAG: Sensor histidine kinase RcsC [Candidatus Omnitrophica bacterium]|nr:Sensor histidine kinase RcsC [Candidatus Omnitrophota bacterium]
MSKILIVDRDEVNREQLKQVLVSAHPEYQVSFAGGGERALEMLKRDLPDLILLDVAPGGDGFDLCLLLKADERFHNIPILITTELHDPEHKLKGFRMGANDYIVKPFNEIETIARVEAGLRIKRYQDRQRELYNELRRAQSALLESTRMSAAGTLANGVAHEFNNILQIIGTYAELCSKTQNADDLREMLGAIKDCTHRAGLIAKNLINITRDDASQKKESVDLAALLSEDLRLMDRTLRESRIELVQRFSEIPLIQGYPGQLSQAFVNLVRNAVEAMQTCPERRLTVGLRLCDCVAAICSADPLKSQPKRRGCVTLTLSDTGDGIPPEVRDRIFEPFVTTKGILGGGQDRTPGTGLGLSITYGVVKRHGGFISVQSSPGKGTTFTVNLPVEV